MKKSFFIFQDWQIAFMKENEGSMTYLEIAEAIGVSERQVKAKLYKIKNAGFPIENNTPQFIPAMSSSPDWSDITEDEMLRGYVAPTYEELSDEEKEIFNKLMSDYE